MNACILCLAAALSTGTSTQAWTTVYVPSNAWMAAVRGQNPTYETSPYLGDPSTQPFTPDYQGGQVAPPSDGFLPPLQPSTPTYDPFMNQPGGVAPYGNAYGPVAPSNGCCGLGPQPYRLGWQHFYDVGWLPKEAATPVGGSMEIFEFDSEWRYTTRTPGFNVFSTAPQFGFRTWDGPANPVTGLPGSVFRFGWDFEWATPGEQPASLVVGFTPSINTDLNQQLSSNAWQFDGRLALFLKSNPQWTWVLGAMVWDRVDTFVLPWAGAIYTPSPRWELRLLFPEARASYYMGKYFGDRVWLYATGEYHVEAYEVGLEPAIAQPGGYTDEVQIEDWRALLGMRFDRVRYAKFIEAGWVFGREVDFKGPTPDFDLSSGFICRAGLRY